MRTWTVQLAGQFEIGGKNSGCWQRYSKQKTVQKRWFSLSFQKKWNPTPERSRKHSETEDGNGTRVYWRKNERENYNVVGADQEGKERESDYIVCHK
jgi:hypothetical protein